MSGSAFVLNQSNVLTQTATTTSQAFPLLGMYPGCTVVVHVLGVSNVGVAFGDASVVATNTGTGNARTYQFVAGNKEVVRPSGQAAPSYVAIIAASGTSDVQITCGNGI